MSEVSLREYIEAHWRAHEREHAATEKALDHTLEQLNDVRMRFVARESHELEHAAVRAHLSSLSRLFVGILIAVLVGLVLLVANLVAS